MEKEISLPDDLQVLVDYLLHEGREESKLATRKGVALEDNRIGAVKTFFLKNFLGKRMLLKAKRV